VAAEDGLAGQDLPDDLEGWLRSCMYQPRYPSYLPA